jgi:Big-like domain-containing protein
VTNVEFLVDTALIGTSTVVPYSAMANNLSAGTHALTATAFDNTGLKATNSITITVTPAVADVPPTVSLTNPAPNTSFQAPATFSIGATASDSDGSVTNVQFLVNGTVIGNSAVVPYSAIANNLTAGNYTLTAIASDNGGLTATNSISVTVTSVSVLPMTLLNPILNGSSFSFAFATQAGITYQGQYVNLPSGTNNWLNFTNLIGDGSVVRVTNSILSPGQRFYRVLAY